MRRLGTTLLFLASSLYSFSQSTMGMSGLLNSPNAVISNEGMVKIGGNFLHERLTPDYWDYDTFNYFLNITFFPFVEIAITNTALDLYDEGKFTNVDRSVCVKFKLLNEGKYYPAVAIGSNDVITSNTDNLFDPGSGNKYFGTHYIAISKHLNLSVAKIGLHAAFNMLSSTKQKINFPLSGGISISPSFCKNLNMIAEYDTRNFNFGGNITIFRHLFIQVLVQDLKYLSFGAYAQFSIL